MNHIRGAHMLFAKNISANHEAFLVVIFSGGVVALVQRQITKVVECSGHGIAIITGNFGHRVSPNSKNFVRGEVIAPFTSKGSKTVERHDGCGMRVAEYLFTNRKRLIVVPLGCGKITQASRNIAQTL